MQKSVSGAAWLPENEHFLTENLCYFALYPNLRGKSTMFRYFSPEI